MGLSLMGIVMMTGSFSLVDIVQAQTDIWFCFTQILGLFVFVVAGIAESHRLPFDLPEAEHELTAGFHTEYGGMKFAMFMLGEYLGLILIACMITTLFFGGWLGPEHCRENGVSLLNINTKVHIPFDSLLNRMGFDLIERIYSKCFKD